MEPAQPNNTKKKVIAGVVVLFAIALLTLGAKALTPKGDVSQTTSSPSTSSATSDTSTDSSPPNDPGVTYKDGTYTATGSYDSPAGNESIDVSITLKNGAITDSTVQAKATDSEAREYQDDFVSGYKAFVTGKNIDSIRLSRVSGSSLTSGGFNAALTKIKDEAKA